MTPIQQIRWLHNTAMFVPNRDKQQQDATILAGGAKRPRDATQPDVDIVFRLTFFPHTQPEQLYTVWTSSKYHIDFCMCIPSSCNMMRTGFSPFVLEQAVWGIPHNSQVHSSPTTFPTSPTMAMSN